MPFDRPKKGYTISKSKFSKKCSKDYGNKNRVSLSGTTPNIPSQFVLGVSNCSPSWPYKVKH